MQTEFYRGFKLIETTNEFGKEIQVWDRDGCVAACSSFDSAYDCIDRMKNAENASE